MKKKTTPKSLEQLTCIVISIIQIKSELLQFVLKCRVLSTITFCLTGLQWHNFGHEL